MICVVAKLPPILAPLPPPFHRLVVDKISLRKNQDDPFSARIGPFRWFWEFVAVRAGARVLILLQLLAFRCRRDEISQVQPETCW